MARPEKVAIVDEIATKLTEADTAVLTEYRGLSVTALAELRAALRPGADYKVFKNTLARRAATQAGLDALVPLFEGPVAIAFVHGDPVPTAKALAEFAREHSELVVKGGVFDGDVVDASAFRALAEVEPRDVLLARLAGGFQAPLVKAASLFSVFTRNFAYGLKAYSEQRSAADPQVPEADAAPAPESPAPESPESESPAPVSPDPEQKEST